MPEWARGVIFLRRGGCWRAGPQHEEVSGGTKGWPAAVGGVRYFCSPCPRLQGAKRGRGGAGAALPALSYCVLPGFPGRDGVMEGLGKGWRKKKGCGGAPAAPLNALIQWSGAYRHQEQGSGPCQMIPRQTRRQTLVLETAP